MNKDVLAAALRLDEAVTLLRIEPFHGTRSRLSLLPWSAAADITRKAGPDRARMIEGLQPRADHLVPLRVLGQRGR